MVEAVNTSYLRYKRNQADLNDSFTKQKENDFHSYSALWSSLFKERQDAGSFNEMIVFLNDDLNATTGINSRISPEKLDLFNRYYEHFLLKSFVEENPLSLVGCPTVTEFRGVAANTTYLTNLRLFKDILDILGREGLATRGLRVLEIGAGYGGVATLCLQSGLAASYTIIDLPENLMLSNYYLTEQFPSFAARVLDSESSDVRLEENHLNFITPGNIEALSACRFDLVINTDSLGEMPSTAAKAYVRWISEHLSEQGRFFSKNGYGRSEDALQAPSDYGYGKMELCELSGFYAPGGLWDDHSHIALFKAGTGFEKLNGGEFDALGMLFRVGLVEESRSVCESFTKREISDDQAAFLHDVQTYIQAPIGSKASSLKTYKDKDLNTCTEFLKGVAAFLDGKRSVAKKHVVSFLETAASNISEATALFMLAQIDGPEVLKRNFNCSTSTEFLVDEIRSYFRYNKVISKLIFASRNDILLKKISAPGTFKLSFAHSLKNLYMNYKTGKGLKITRY